MEFQKTPGWLDWYAGPSRPAFAVPADSVDAHCHVFGPGHEFPFAPERKYTPCDASKAQLFALRDHLGFARNVIVQATCHGADNRALVDACRASGGRARGVATVRRSVTDEELADLHQAGGIPHLTHLADTSFHGKEGAEKAANTLKGVVSGDTPITRKIDE
mgnify:CR=1 FL=1